MIRHHLPIAMAAFSLSLSSFAGPPLEFDDPDTPGPGNWEINLASTMEKRDGLWEFKPLLDLNYGWGERIQLKLKPRLVVIDPPEDGARAGAGNIQLGVKWRFLDEDKQGVAMSIYPQVDINPPGRSVARGFVDRGADFYVPFQMARSFGNTRVYLDAGFNFREAREDEWIVGLAIEQRVNSRVVLMAELRDIAEADADDHELFFNIGGKVKIHDNWVLLAAAGRTIDEPRGHSLATFSYLGIQFLF